MKKRLLSLLLCAAMVMAMLAGCGNSKDSGNDSVDDKGTDSKSEDGPDSGKVYKIGVSTQAWKYEFIKNMVNALNKLDDDMDQVELVMVDSEDSVEKQLSDVDTMIAQGVDGILLNCLSFEGSSSAVEACKNAGIPLGRVYLLYGKRRLRHIRRHRRKVLRYYGNGPDCRCDR